MKQSLFEIGQELKTLQQQLEDELINTGGDVTEGTEGANIEQAIAGIEWKQKEKVDAYVGLIRNIQADAARVDEAIALLQRRGQILYNQVERLKNCAKLAMQAQGIEKVTGIVHGGMRIQLNAATPLELLEIDAEKWPAKFVRIKKEINKTLVADTLKKVDGAAEIAGFAKLGERGTHLRVI